MQVVLLAAIILPLSVGVVVKAFAWQIVLRRDGIVSQLMVDLGIWDEPVRLLFTETGLVLGAANVFLPFMILPIYSVVKLIDPRLNEAGATLGATPLYRFRRITLPLTLPGVLTGIAFVFSLSVSMYVIPSLLIGDRFQTLSTLTGRSFLLMRNEQLGSTTATCCWCWRSPSSSAPPGSCAASGGAYDPGRAAGAPFRSGPSPRSRSYSCSRRWSSPSRCRSARRRSSPCRRPTGR